MIGNLCVYWNIFSSLYTPPFNILKLPINKIIFIDNNILKKYLLHTLLLKKVYISF